jgi:hypothetical protein
MKSDTWIVVAVALALTASIVIGQSFITSPQEVTAAARLAPDRPVVTPAVVDVTVSHEQVPLPVLRTALAEPAQAAPIVDSAQAAPTTHTAQAAPTVDPAQAAPAVDPPEPAPEEQTAAAEPQSWTVLVVQGDHAEFVTHRVTNKSEP